MSPMPQKRRARPEPAAVAPADFPFRPPRWVRVWAIALGAFAVVVVLVFGIPFAASGRWGFLAPLLVVVLLAVALVWRVGGLVARPTPDGTLLVRNRTKTHRLARTDVKSVGTGHSSGRAATPVAALTLANGSEVLVDATLSAAFQHEHLDAQVAALKAWHKG